jgi:hypothetical protein
MIELLIVVVVTTMIVYFAYKIFFSQTRMVTSSIEFMEVNDSFRKINTFLGDDIREATSIARPVPVFNEMVGSLTTRPGLVLRLQTSEIDPRIAFDSPLGGQVCLRRQIDYELEKVKNPNNGTNGEEFPHYRLIRTSTIIEEPGNETTQRQELAEKIREFVVYRTIRKPFKPSNISSDNDRIAVARPLHDSGTGNSLVHVRMVLERDRKKTEKGEVYNIDLHTSFYKRGKEIFKNP